MKLTTLLAVCFFLVSLPAITVKAQKVKSAPFSYVPEKSDDGYNQRVPQKTFALANGDFIILAHKSATEYALERYTTTLKRVWTTPIAVTSSESIERFLVSPTQALVVIYNRSTTGQSLFAQPVSLADGQKAPGQKLVVADSRSRRPGVAVSADGTKLLAWTYTTHNKQIRAIQAKIYDERLNKPQERTYDFSDVGSFFSTTLHIGNDGTQYVVLLSDGLKKLSVRCYRNDRPDVKVMAVAVGGTFGGKEVTVFDARSILQPDNSLYTAAICTERLSGQYYSLKMVKFDFTALTMKFADEFRFTPEYLAQVNQLAQTKASRLEDVYLSDLLLNEEKQVVVVAEKKYEEGGDESVVRAKELHLFGYNEFEKPVWHHIIAKDQVAPPAESFTGIGYRAAVFGLDLHLLTQEKIKDKSDLYVRLINVKTGDIQPAKGLGLNVASDQNLAYVKDFTTWLDSKTIIGVSRPSKKSAALMLNKITVK